MKRKQCKDFLYSIGFIEKESNYFHSDLVDVDLRDDDGCDFNINDADPENEKLDEILIDSWKALYFDDKGYTWNKEKNYLARMSSAWDDPNERIDRIFVNHAEWLDSMELLGTEPIDDNLWPSDHFGLLGVFKI